MNIRQLIHTLTAGEVARYHAVPTVRPQPDGLHCWNMLVLALYITDNDCSWTLLREIIGHDTGELTAGDTPFTVKRDYPGIDTLMSHVEKQSRINETTTPPLELTVQEHAILKICDTLEGFIWCAKYENVSRMKDLTLTQDRWDAAYQRCREKWPTVVTPAEWARADEIYAAFSSKGCAS